MKRINVIYDGNFDDADILAVPDDIANNIETVVQEFNDWLSVPNNRKQFLIPYGNGRMVLSIGTGEFLWWLNHIKIMCKQEAVVLDQHTVFVPDLPTAEF